MRGRNWQTAFGIAVIIHLIILGVLGYALREALKEEIQYVEVTMDESFADEPDSQPAGGGQQAANQDNNPPVQQAEKISTPVVTEPQKNVENVVTEPQKNAENVALTPAIAVNNSNTSTGSTGTGISSSGTGNGTGTGTGSGTGTGAGTGVGHGTGRGSKRDIKLVYKTKIPYPTEARQSQNVWEGIVKLRVSVSADGRIQEVRIVKSSGYEILDRAAVEEVRRNWLFSPALNADGQPFDAAVVVPVKFDLKEASY